MTWGRGGMAPKKSVFNPSIRVLLFVMDLKNFMVSCFDEEAEEMTVSLREAEMTTAKVGAQSKLHCSGLNWPRRRITGPADCCDLSGDGFHRTPRARNALAFPHDCVPCQLQITALPQDLDMETISKGVQYRGGQSILSGPRYCPGVNSHGGYLCETGHCCGETGCCTYYYELWWFWLLWTVLILFSCCCAYRHRRAKLRIQQQQRQREINLIAYHGACNYPASMLDLSFLASFKLPSYEEVAARPNTPPPPYNTVFALQGAAAQYAHAGPSGMASSHSSDNYTSCSCESCSASSPCSTSFSVQVTDETDTSNATTPSEVGDPCPLATDAGSSSTSLPPPTLSDPLGVLVEQEEDGGLVEEPPEEQPSPKPAQSPPRHALFSPNVDFFEPDGRASEADVEEDEEEAEEADEGHFRHRRLTGDSGIEVCRCQVDSEDEEEEQGHQLAGGKEVGEREEAEGQEEPGLLHDSVDCSARPLAPAPPADDCTGLCGSTSFLHRGGDSVVVMETV
ncbi:WW domain binding protein 1-like isoform X1 [Brienomyrus brachyistius]|uniref:WW domain binding protein 1-like isoform X1 n=1 Tax=Brienomyrus brachyistius TaxID=42636 RepID=UPI0020B198C1|nr:WW domain binding protein 1-like isoform X1 [Brienomyrus brachyistius]